VSIAKFIEYFTYARINATPGIKNNFPIALDQIYLHWFFPSIAEAKVNPTRIKSFTEEELLLVS
jgi:hypothetical protein